MGKSANRMVKCAMVRGAMPGMIVSAASIKLSATKDNVNSSVN